jgi:hypothetical protein
MFVCGLDTTILPPPHLALTYATQTKFITTNIQHFYLTTKFILKFLQKKRCIFATVIKHLL